MTIVYFAEGLENYNKKRAVMLAATLLAAVSLTGISVVAASTWTITSVTVPKYGGGSGTKGASNTKVTNDNYASFNGDVQPNAFGYNVRLVNSKGAAKTSYVGLYKDKTKRASDNSGLAHYYYWADVHSKNVEPSTSTVKLHFSADKK